MQIPDINSIIGNTYEVKVSKGNDGKNHIKSVKLTQEILPPIKK